MEKKYLAQRKHRRNIGLFVYAKDKLGNESVSYSEYYAWKKTKSMNMY